MSSRRAFLKLGGGAAGATWLALHAPAIVKAAEAAAARALKAANEASQNLQKAAELRLQAEIAARNATEAEIIALSKAGSTEKCTDCLPLRTIDAPHHVPTAPPTPVEEVTSQTRLWADEAETGDGSPNEGGKYSVLTVVAAVGAAGIFSVGALWVLKKLVITIVVSDET